jgi:O-methyltransferase
MKHSHIVYQPSLTARMAQSLLPVLRGVLPVRLYKWVYDFLYRSYKRGLRALYFFRVLQAKLFGSKKDALRARLTFKLLPYTMGGRKALENAFNLTALVESKNIPGALVECGVAEGGSAAMMALTNRELGKSSRQKWFFDSYEGLPEPTVEDYIGDKVGPVIRPIHKGECLGTIEQVQNLMFEKLSLSREEVHLVKGWFQDTVPLQRKNVGPIAILRLDGDWYESTKIPLENFYAQITPGGYVIIDDYATCFGSRKATDEFVAALKMNIVLQPDGRGGAWFEKPAGVPNPYCAESLTTRA